MSAEAIAELFFQNIQSKYGLFVSIISDQKPEFVSKMWDFLCKLLKIKTKLFSAHHLVTNSQSEIAN